MSDNNSTSDDSGQEDMVKALQLEPKRGLLSPVGDLLGSVLGAVVSPVGIITGGVGGPTGDAAMAAKNQAKREMGLPVEEDEDDENDKEKSDKERPGGERIGGNPQSGGNPLGL